MQAAVTNGGLEAEGCLRGGPGLPGRSLCLLLWVSDSLEIILVSASFPAMHWRTAEDRNPPGYSEKDDGNVECKEAIQEEISPD